jgi:hypothetical protein
MFAKLSDYFDTETLKTRRPDWFILSCGSCWEARRTNASVVLFFGHNVELFSCGLPTIHAIWELYRAVANDVLSGKTAASAEGVSWGRTGAAT